MIPIYAVCGIAYGMVELIRRIIPRDIVGGDVQKLRKMDSIVCQAHFLASQLPDTYRLLINRNSSI